jgi:hypothetical protein
LYIFQSLALPFYSKYLQAQLRKPDEINIENIKKRVISDPLKHEKLKEKLRLEDRLKKEYTIDEKHEWVKREIQKTLKELEKEDQEINKNY